MKKSELKKMIKEEMKTIQENVWQNTEEQYNELLDTISNMNPRQFLDNVRKMGGDDYDIWMSQEGEQGIDLNNMDDIIDTIDLGFEQDDLEKYYNFFKSEGIL